MNTQDLNFFSDFLKFLKFKYQINSLAFINLHSPKFNLFSLNLKKKYLKSIHNIPEYIKISIEERVNPSISFPWAKSVLVAAVPFNNIPTFQNFLPEADDNNQLFGLIAPYATKLDYHIFAKKLLNDIVDDFISLIDDNNLQIHETFKCEPCVDTKPIAEKALAIYSNVGKFGKNHLIQTQDYAADSFLIELFTNLEIPDIKEKNFLLKCSSCNKCYNSCPTGAIFDSAFDYKKCISALTMEKRGVLSHKERRMISHWIFGCDICSSSCPGSSQPKPFKADLQWILNSTASDVKHHIIGTPLNYAGVTILRRNALAVLENIGTNEAFELIQTFSEKTQSSILKISASEILHQKSIT